MLEPGTLISVQLPDREGEVVAKVIKCSPTGRSCQLELVEEEETVNVNLTKAPHTVLEPTSDDENEDGEESEEGEEEELDAFRALSAPSVALDRLVAQLAADPAKLLHRSEGMAAVARDAAKELIDYASKQQQQGVGENGNGGEHTTAAAAAAAELYVDGFDAEQIWLQLDMLSAPALKRARRQLRKVESVAALIPADVEEALDELLLGDDGGFEGESDEEGEEEEEGGSDFEEEDGSDGGMDYDAMLAAGGGSGSDEEAGDEEERENIEEEEEPQQQKKQRGKRGRMSNAEAKAAVEDDFMRLDEMEAFLRQAEQEEGGEGEEEEGRDVEMSGSDLDDDAFGQLSGEEEEEGGEGDDSEAELEALLDNAAKLVGRNRGDAAAKKKKKRGVRFAGDSEEEEPESEEEAVDLSSDPLANARYEDFFGPRKKRAPGSAARKAPPPPPAQRGSKGLLAEDVSSSEDDFADGEGEGYSEEEEEDEEEDEKIEAAGGSSSEEEEPAKPSTHQRRLERVSGRVKQLEHEAMEERPWFLQGEVMGTTRPKNSALEIDLDFETTARPPPAPTEESTRSIEDLIKARIADGRFDDPLSLVAPHPDRKRTVVEMDDKKSSAGLGELYERDYVAAVTGAVEDRDAPVRELAKAQFAALAAQLDTLSHGHFRPAPSIEEVSVKVDVPAIMMEEAAPAFVSGASMRAPEEVYKAGTGAISGAGDGEGEEEAGATLVLRPGGVVKSEAELTKEDRRRRRAAKKRAYKKRKASQEEEAAARAAARGLERVAGRKSEEQEQELRKLAKGASKRAKSGVDANGVSDYSKSTAVFAQIQAQRDAGPVVVGAGDEAAAAAAAVRRASAFKL